MEAQKTNDASARLQTLTPAQREALLKKLLAQKGNGADGNGADHKVAGATSSHKPATITPMDRTQDLPLSFAQRRQWILYQQMEGRNAAYNSPLFLQLTGPLNRPALEQAIAEIVRRHEVLRTTFVAAPVGSPLDALQVIAPTSSIVMPFVDLQTLAAATRQSEAQRLAQAELTQPFVLETGPLLRVKLLRLAPESHVLLIVMHHIVCDGWSMDIFAEELSALYKAFCVGEPSPLPPLPIQYADFAYWQQQRLQGDFLQTQLNYWQRQLAGAPALLELPTDRPRPAAQSYQGRSEFSQINQDVVQKLMRISQSAGVTPFMMLHAAFTVLLARISGSEDIVIGSAIANRLHRQIEPLIGFFVNTLVLRTDLTGNPSFLELLARVRQVTLDAYSHQDLPFEKLVDELQPTRSLSYHPLFQVVFGLQQNATWRGMDLPELTITPFEWENTTTLFDLALFLRQTETGLAAEWDYNCDLFNSETIRRMAGHFAVLLDAIAQDPTQPIHALPIMTAAEIRQLQDWNATAADVSRGQTVVDLFEQQARQTPDHIAVVFENQQLTYHELNARANQLAHYLRSLRIGSTADRLPLVGLCLERSLDLIVGWLGILKAGGAYVPFDPAYPQERLNFMVADAQLQMIVTQAALLDRLPSQGLRVVCLDAERPQWARQPAENLRIAITTDQLAYVIYTSGSTGRPKGVMVENRGLVNLAQAQIHAFAVEPPSRVLQFASTNFDASVSEIAMALCCGATLVLANLTDLQPGPSLTHTLQAQAITHVTLVPSVLSTLDPYDLPALQTLVVAGEACPPALANLWSTGRRFLNGYGPTESTVCATIMDYTGMTSDQSPPIGRPMTNCQIHILDRHQQPLPVGVPGEIYIGGIGLARGYLNRPELTAERFVTLQNQRLYKTGDLARWLPDGNIEFLGRIDHQVKLRGFRIELGEIEATLTNHPAIREAVVLAREDQPGHKQLVGYLVADQADAAIETEHVAQWQNLYEDGYSDTPDLADRAFNLTGWNSSYTGQPIPAVEMAEWVAETVADIRRLAPERILEIGCGAGLLLARLAPECAEYWGVDFSRQALQQVAQLKATVPGLSHVHLEQRNADALIGIPEGHFDCILLNSIVQYFPSGDYLLRVLEGAVRAAKPGGVIYVGDVRNLRLLQAYHAALQLYQASDDLTLSHLQARIQQQVQDEGGLLIDPEFFYALPRHLPQIAQVEVTLKRGAFQNELTQFRYQAFLHIAPATVGQGARPAARSGRSTSQPQEPGAAQNHWLEFDWLQGRWPLATLTDKLRQLAETSPDAGLLIRNIPNGRIAAAAQTVAVLQQSDDGHSRPARVAALRAHLAAQATGIDPQTLWALAETLPYTVHITWARAADLMDVCFVPHAPVADRNVPPIFVQSSSGSRPGAAKTWRDHVNNPLLGKLNYTLIPQVRSWLQTKLPDHMIPAAFVLLDALPLTPNGKVDRQALPSPVNLRLVDDAFAPPRTATEIALAGIWSALLGIEDIGIHDNFFELGGDSILSIQVKTRAHRLGIDLTARQIMQFQTIAQLAAAVDGKKDGVDGSDYAIPVQHEILTGTVPLLPMQHLFFALPNPNPHLFNHSQLLETPVDVRPELLRKAVQGLLRQHDALRMRFVQVDGQWQQFYSAPTEEIPFSVIDLSHLPPAEQQAAIKLADAELQASLHLTDGPIMRVAYLHLGVSPGRLLFVIHHLVIDLTSWRILLDDLLTAYQQLDRGETIRFLPKTTSCQDWAYCLLSQAQSDRLAYQLDYWLTQIDGNVIPLPRDFPPASDDNVFMALEMASVVLPADATRRLLQKAPAIYNAQINDLLLTALVHSFARWTGKPALLVEFQDNGRRDMLCADIDLSRTVGWMTANYPVLLTLAAADQPVAAVQTIKQQLQRVPERGFGYGLLRYLHPDAAIRQQIQGQPKAQVTFTYFGQYDQMLQIAPGWRFAQDERASSYDPLLSRGSYFFNVHGVVIDGKLQLNSNYSTRIHRQETVQGLLHGMADYLKVLIDQR